MHVNGLWGSCQIASTYSSLRKKLKVPSAISTEHSSLKDDSLASFKAVHALHWGSEVIMLMLQYAHWSHSMLLLFLMM